LRRTPKKLPTRNASAVCFLIENEANEDAFQLEIEADGRYALAATICDREQVSR
jgi:hypothetical protein